VLPRDAINFGSAFKQKTNKMNFILNLQSVKFKKIGFDICTEVLVVLDLFSNVSLDKT
jgi:hypothetical protein